MPMLIREGTQRVRKGYVEESPGMASLVLGTALRMVGLGEADRTAMLGLSHQVDKVDESHKGATVSSSATLGAGKGTTSTGWAEEHRAELHHAPSCSLSIQSQSEPARTIQNHPKALQTTHQRGGRRAFGAALVAVAVAHMDVD
ncbi:hypothetical protein E4U41_006755 [Claviceps citrina]|nr:hypothetical protein E4U41_006755 [Claviceps citrina]